MPASVHNAASNDGNKVMPHLKLNFSEASNNSQDAEAFFYAQNEDGALGNFAFDRIAVNEIVTGGAVLGSWTGGSCTQCCGQRWNQNRTCTPSKDCDGVITKRIFACHWICPLKCGTVRTFTFDVTLTDHKWKKDYESTNSDAYKKLYDTLTIDSDSFLNEVKKLFSKLTSKTGYDHAKDSIYLTRDGDYVRVSFDAVFGKPPANADDPEAIFLYETEHGKLGNFNIDVKSIKTKEKTNGYNFTEWQTVQDSCVKCCGGEVTQTRKCSSKVGKCTNAQIERKIRCKHVCNKVECSGSSSKVNIAPFFAAFPSFLVSIYWYWN